MGLKKICSGPLRGHCRPWGATGEFWGTHLWESSEASPTGLDKLSAPVQTRPRASRDTGDQPPVCRTHFTPVLGCQCRLGETSATSSQTWSLIMGHKDAGLNGVLLRFPVSLGVQPGFLATSVPPQMKMRGTHTAVARC